MNSIPDRLFINLYPAGIGRCIGSAYSSRRDADAVATSQRIECVEVAPSSVLQLQGVIFVRADLYSCAQEQAAKEGKTVRELVEALLAAKVEVAV